MDVGRSQLTVVFVDTENKLYVWRMSRRHICEAEYVFMHLDILLRRSFILAQRTDMMMHLCVLLLQHVLNLYEQ